MYKHTPQGMLGLLQQRRLPHEATDATTAEGLHLGNAVVVVVVVPILGFGRSGRHCPRAQLANRGGRGTFLRLHLGSDGMQRHGDDRRHYGSQYHHVSFSRFLSLLCSRLPKPQHAQFASFPPTHTHKTTHFHLEPITKLTNSTLYTSLRLQRIDHKAHKFHALCLQRINLNARIFLAGLCRRIKKVAKTLADSSAQHHFPNTNSIPTTSAYLLNSHHLNLNLETLNTPTKHGAHPKRTLRAALRHGP